MNRVHVIVQVPSDAGQVVHDFDAQLRQFTAGAHAREHQDLRRLQGASGHQHFVVRADLLCLAVAPELDAGRSLPLEQDARGVRIREDREVLAAEVGCEVGLGDTEALAVPLRDLVGPDAFLLRAVEVVVDGKACLATGVDERLQGLVGAAQVRHVERTLAAVVLVGDSLVVLGTAEVRQYFVVGPTRVAFGRPMVVVGPVAADVDHRVDRARAAQHLAARLPADAAVQALLRHRVEVPVGDVPLGEQRETRGHVDQDVVVHRAGLDQRHRHRRILAEPRRQHAAARAAAHHDVVEIHACLFLVVRQGISQCGRRDWRPTPMQLPGNRHKVTNRPPSAPIKGRH